MTWRDAAIEWARQHFPREACGLVIVRKGREQFIPCRNIAEGQDHFILSPDDYADAEDQGEVVGVFHSHPNASPQPSEADRVSCEETGVEWHIVSLPDGVWHSFKPAGYVAPLIGRPFQHGVLDCYALIRDWYKQERGIILPNHVRTDDWWLRGENLYMDNYRSDGWVEDDLHVGAMIYMQIGSPVPNHAAVYIGDDMILHHLRGRLSSRDIYGGFYKKHTVKVLRYAGNQALR